MYSSGLADLKGQDLPSSPPPSNNSAATAGTSHHWITCSLCSLLAVLGPFNKFKHCIYLVFMIGERKKVEGVGEAHYQCPVSSLFLTFDHFIPCYRDNISRVQCWRCFLPGSKSIHGFFLLLEEGLHFLALVFSWPSIIWLHSQLLLFPSMPLTFWWKWSPHLSLPLPTLFSMGLCSCWPLSIEP